MKIIFMNLHFKLCYNIYNSELIVGFLVVDYVTGNEDCFKYLHKISSEKDNYNGFTLVTMDFR